MKNPYTPKLRHAFASVLMCVAAAQAQAFTIQTTESRYEASGVRYSFAVSNWTTNDGGLNPCTSDESRYTSCGITLVAKMPMWSSGRIVASYSHWDVPIRRGHSDLGDLLRDLQTAGFRIPLSGSVLVPYDSANNTLCISFASATVGPNIGSAYNAFGPCTPVVAPALQCDITGDTNINHRTLSDAEVDGAKASTKLNLQCRGPASVTVFASRTNANGVLLRDDGSLYSKITINGKDATAGINVAVTNDQVTPMNIESTLFTRGSVTPGAFSGSTVITVTPP
ncbi:MAG: hypothetical protein ACN6QE_10545 [Pseudomonas putida]